MARIRVPGLVGGVLKGGSILDDISELIRNPPSTPVGGAIGRGGQRFCNALSAAPALAFGVLQAQGVIGTIVCQPYLDQSGFDLPAPAPPPFPGGQCPGVSYSVTYQNFDSGAPFGSPVTFTINGPVELRKEVSGNTQAFNFYSGGVFVRQAISGAVSSDPNTVVTSINRVDGQPDDCGDFPTELEPGVNPAPQPIGYTPGIDFGLGDDGQPFFDVPDLVDPITGDPVPFEDPFSSVDSPIAAPQPLGDGVPGENDSVGDSLGEIVGGDEGEEVSFGEPPLGKIWVGCLVEFQAGTNYGGIPGTGPENTVYPTTIGNVSLRFAAGRGQSTQARSRWIEAIRPSTALVVEGAFVQARLGVTASVYPISVTVCKEPLCPLE